MQLTTSGCFELPVLVVLASWSGGVAQTEPIAQGLVLWPADKTHHDIGWNLVKREAMSSLSFSIHLVKIQDGVAFVLGGILVDVGGEPQVILQLVY